MALTLRAAMDAIGVTTAELAAELGVSPRHVRQMRLDQRDPGYRPAPGGWQNVLAQLARRRAAELRDVAGELDPNADAFDELELEAVAADVTYELWMFLDAAERLAESDPGGDRVLNNAFIEAMAIHCRNLDEFFFALPHADDVRASFYKGVDLSVHGGWRSSPGASYSGLDGRFCLECAMDMVRLNPSEGTLSA